MIKVHPINELESFEGKIYLVTPTGSGKGDTAKMVFARITAKKLMEQYPKVRVIAPYGYLPIFLDSNDPKEFITARIIERDIFNICNAVCFFGFTDGFDTEMKIKLKSAFDADKDIFVSEQVPEFKEILRRIDKTSG